MQNVLIDDRRIWVDLWVIATPLAFYLTHTHFSQLTIRVTLEQWTVVK